VTDSDSIRSEFSRRVAAHNPPRECRYCGEPCLLATTSWAFRVCERCFRLMDGLSPDAWDHAHQGRTPLAVEAQGRIAGWLVVIGVVLALVIVGWEIMR